MEQGLSVIVPVYNSEAALEPLIARLAPVLNALGCWYEVILVNDGSRDRSAETARRLQETYGWIRAVELMRNYGQHNALLCGIRLARFDTIVTIDDDLQHPPEEIPKLLEALDAGCDVVYGTPERERHGFLRDCASRITKWTLQAAMGVDAARNVSAFRAFRTPIREAFAHYQSPLVSIDVLLTWGAARFGVVRVRHDPRTIGVSNYTVRKLITHAINMFTGFTTLPLQLASILGFASALFGALVLLFVIGRYLLEGGVVPGFAFLASSIALFAGVQLFALGIVGEYLARIHLRTMDKPPYVVRDDRPGA